MNEKLVTNIEEEETENLKVILRKIYDEDDLDFALNAIELRGLGSFFTGQFQDFLKAYEDQKIEVADLKSIAQIGMKLVFKNLNVSGIQVNTLNSIIKGIELQIKREQNPNREN